jgi:hypothetical protein
MNFLNLIFLFYFARNFKRSNINNILLLYVRPFDDCYNFSENLLIMNIYNETYSNPLIENKLQHFIPKI